MRAAVMRNRALVVADGPVPKPEGSWIPPRRRPGRAGARPPSIANRAGRPRCRRGGVLDRLMASAPRGTRIVVVGVCMEADTIHPMLGISEELNLQFVLGYTPEEFAATLGHIATGAIPTAPLITGHVGLEGRPRHSRISPRRSATPRFWCTRSAESGSLVYQDESTG